MNRIVIKALNLVRRLYGSWHPSHALPLHRNDNPDQISAEIERLLLSDAPCMISRFGSCELNCANNYLSIKQGWHNVLKYLKGEVPAFWWQESVVKSMANNAGFFSNTTELLARFAERYLEDARQIDILGSWCQAEHDVADYISGAYKANLLYLEPYFAQHPWSRVLAGKKILVVHPFAQLIKRQYEEHRQQLFENQEVLPLFELSVLPAVQSIGGVANGFDTWFDALHSMEEAIDGIDYDICILGCGAYGLPLAAHVKRSGKKAIHLGGATQLLFGIKGKRWENPEYGSNEPGFPHGFYLSLFNEYWVRPGENDKPASANKIENGCYW